MHRLKYFAKHFLSQIPIVLVILDLHFDGKLHSDYWCISIGTALSVSVGFWFKFSLVCSKLKVAMIRYGLFFNEVLLFCSMLFTFYMFW